MKQIFITIVTFLMIMLAACATETTSNNRNDSHNNPTDPHNNPIDTDDNIPEGTIFRLTLDSHSADTAGTQNIYLKYDCGYYLDESCDKKMTVKDLSIDCPTRDGYRFLGYNTDGDMYGDMVISYKGFIDCDVTFKDFKENTTLYAVWKEYSGPSVVVHDKEANKGVIFSRDGRTLLYYQRDLSNDTYEIPEGVTEIARDAFRDCIYLKHVKFPDSLTKVGDNAFQDCIAFESVDIGKGMEEFDNDAFYGCTVLNKVNYRGTIAKWCSIKFSQHYHYTANPIYYAHCLYINDELLTDLVIPDNVTEIGICAFQNCTSIESVTIGKGLAYSNNYAFSGCTGIKKVNYRGTIAQWCGLFFYPCPVEFSHNLYINDELLTDVVIPDGVTSVGYFTGCEHITSVSIPDSVTSIRASAFEGCKNIKGELYLPPKLEYMGSYAFAGCSGLTGSIVIPSTLTRIDNCVFKGCSGLTGTLDIPETVTDIWSEAFAGCSGLTSITIPDSVTYIDEGLLAGCTGLEYLSVPYIGEDKDYEFFDDWDSFGLTDETPICERHYSSKWNLLEYIFDDGIRDTDYYLYNEKVPSSLKTVVVRGGQIGDCAFDNCACIEHIELPLGITRIGNDAFKDCAALKSITIPNTVTEIGEYAFYGCSSLSGTIKLPSGVTSIRPYLFAGCSGISNIVLPSSLTGIGSYAFQNCESLKDITFPQTLTYIGGSAFVNTKSFKTLVIPDNITEFGQWSYMDGTFAESGIQSITLGSGVREIGRQAFYNCDRLESIDIPDNVTKIGDLAFNDCDALLSVRIGNGVIEIGDYSSYGSGPSGMDGVFAGCDSLRHLTIGNSVKIIHSYAFNGCHNLTGHLVLPESLETIEQSAFGMCDGIISVDFGSKVTNLAEVMYNVALETIICRAAVPPFISAAGPGGWDSFNFGNIKTVYVPADSLSAYQGDEYWRDFFGYSPNVEYKSLDELP